MMKKQTAYTKKQAAQTDHMQPDFKVNMRIIADVLERELKRIEFYFSDCDCRLDEVRLYNPKKELNSNYVYLIGNSDVNRTFTSFHRTAFIVIGRTDCSFFSGDAPVIQVIDESSFLDIFDLVQDTFEKYRNWAWNLQQALHSSRPLDEMILASMEVFHNPMFIHDANFYILADPAHVPGMLSWDIDPRTGRQIVPVSQINDFMVDSVYLEGMKSKKAVLFPQEQRGYPILYYNLWNDGHYEGRILVDEIIRPIQPGDFYALEYLGHMVEQCIKNKKLILLSVGNDIESFFMDFLDGKIRDERSVIPYLDYLSWDRNDRYLCLSLMSDQKEINMVSTMATLGQIEAQISSGYATLYKNSVAVIVNLSYSDSTAADILSKLALTLRDGLLKAGISSECTDFMLVPQAYRQAHIALEFGRNSKSMLWYYYFDDYMLDYIIDSASREIPIRLLCTDSLCELQKYDEENHTDLYNTLRVYLRLNRNVLQTSKELFIHRSTLMYRLTRINQITGIDLDDPKECLKISISYYMLEGEV